MLTPESKEALAANYRNLLREHRCSPEATQMSAEGQAFRFEKLAEIGDLSDHTVLDLGCGIGDFFPVLSQHHPDVQYTGLDILPEMIDCARTRFSGVEFLSRDILQDGLDREFDYVLISAMFNNDIPDGTGFLKQMVAAAFAKCRIGLGFNFISNRVNFSSPGMAYHDPMEVLGFCIDQLSRKVNLHHHYARCDVSVFVYR